VIFWILDLIATSSTPALAHPEQGRAALVGRVLVASSRLPVLVVAIALAATS
jgi:hypothetical protein